MWPRLFALLLAASCAAGDAARAGVPAGAGATLFADGPHRGMSYAHAMRDGRGYGSEDSARSLQRLADLGVEWITITPFGFQREAAAPGFRWLSRGRAASARRTTACRRSLDRRTRSA
jgi:hypothetical protein